MDRDELARAACRGDVDARNKLGPWLFGELRRYFARSFSHRQRIHDLCQDAMLDLWTKAPQQRPQTAAELRKLALGIAGITVKRTRTELLREQERRAMLELIPSPEPSRSPSTKLTQREVLERFVRQLSTPLRETVRCRLAGRDEHEFAAEQGITVETVRTRHYQAVKKLRQLLAQEGISASQCGL